MKHRLHIRHFANIPTANMLVKDIGVPKHPMCISRFTNIALCVAGQSLIPLLVRALSEAMLLGVSQTTPMPEPVKGSLPTPPIKISFLVLPVSVSVPPKPDSVVFVAVV
jgi:hypothetical protein